MALSTFHIQDKSLTSLGDSRLLVQCETGISDIPLLPAWKSRGIQFIQ